MIPTTTTWDNLPNNLATLSSAPALRARDEVDERHGKTESIYTYGFLATLITLCAISTTIVIWARRRQRLRIRMIEEAIRSRRVASRETGTKGEDFGEQPVLWEASLE
ncbi:hypothetical protein AAF712_012445 [Marasmius tenuissimus]|uniref:Uncharacterized protein n=1 Tax=Marasmius tenuissimus TaxID=585030 RepID=A0ABR2ZHR3_9AGAR